MVRTPSLALSRSMQFPLASVGEHIEPVRSIAMTTSTGVEEHGLHAFACADRSKWLTPKSFANQVFVWAVPATVSSFGFTAALQPVAMIAVFVQDAMYVKLKLLMLAGVLAAAYDCAVAVAVVTSGRSCAPASAAASAADCNWRFA